MIDEGRPIFLQIAESIEDAILDGSLLEDSQAPSINELAAFHRINPATAAKGVNMLVDNNILVKRRGVGMFVAPGAQSALRNQRRTAFATKFIDPLLAEAQAIGLSASDVTELIRSHTSQLQETGQKGQNS